LENTKKTIKNKGYSVLSNGKKMDNKYLCLKEVKKVMITSVIKIFITAKPKRKNIGGILTINSRPTVGVVI